MIVRPKAIKKIYLEYFKGSLKGFFFIYKIENVYKNIIWDTSMIFLIFFIGKKLKK
jgi:hypothetical protein